MGLDVVVEDILRKGEEKKREIVRLGEKERQEQLQQAEKRIAEDRQKAERRFEAHVRQMEQQELSSGELESRKSLLAAQRQVMEDLKLQVLSELSSYSADKRRRLYARLVQRAKKELGECFVYSNAEDKGLLQLPAGMSFAGTVECRGGLVFENKDRSFRLDYRFESMLEDVWNKNMQEIYTKLFG